ncbi:MAG TPA: hypothetical protein VMT53_02160 [Terriglobales bacterium]|nr:hypothetical protein [Terriglobales bacterium]
MKNEDLFRCPLLQGLDAMHRAELLGLINDSNLRERLEVCLAQLKAAEASSGAPSTESAATSFDQKVHEWNPKLPLWTRSPKE